MVLENKQKAKETNIYKLETNICNLFQKIFQYI